MLDFESRNVKNSDLHSQIELEAHIFRIRSTGEYYKCVQYEFLTPTQVRVIEDLIFLPLNRVSKILL